MMAITEPSRENICANTKCVPITTRNAGCDEMIIIIIRILEYPGSDKIAHLTCDLLSDHLLMSPGNTVMITPKTTTAII